MEIECTLTEEERRAWALELRAGLYPRVLRRRLRDDGIEVQFEKTGEILRDLGDFIAFESRCCEFLRFDLCVESQSDIVTLRLSGPKGTRAFVDRWFDPEDPDWLVDPVLCHSFCETSAAVIGSASRAPR